MALLLVLSALAALVGAAPTPSLVPKGLEEPPPFMTSLRLQGQSSVLIAQIADVHLGENAERNEVYLQQVSTVLDMQNVDLAVMAGDQVNGALLLNVSNVAKWLSLGDELNKHRIPHTAIMGNHDSVTKPETDSSNLQKALRGEILEADARQRLSYSVSDEGDLLAGDASRSVFLVDVLPQTGLTPLLSIVHLDSGASGVPNEFGYPQITWFREVLNWRRALYAPTKPPPVLVFAHYPLDQFEVAWAEAEDGECWGEHWEGDGNPAIERGASDSDALVEVMSQSPEVVGYFAAHLHCNNYCCRSNGTNLCFGQHSSAGRYYCVGPKGSDSVDQSEVHSAAAGNTSEDPNEVHTDDDSAGRLFDTNDGLKDIKQITAENGMGFGLRLIELTAQSGGAWQLETRIALTNGSVVHRAVLADSATA